MKRLNVFCEGSTEQGFCAQVLQPHLFPNHDGIIHTLAVGRKGHHHVKGLSKYSKVRKFILNTLKQLAGKDVYFTTLFDLYGLPDDFPGKADNKRNPADPASYVRALELALGQDINHYRFIPHLQLHEYETMLFADPEAFAYSFDNCATEIQKLKEITCSCPSIEHINDDPATAPSKQIIKMFPAYGGLKSTAGHCCTHRRHRHPPKVSALRGVADAAGKPAMGRGLAKRRRR